MLSPEERAARLMAHFLAAGICIPDSDYVFHELTETIRAAGTESAKMTAALIKRGEVKIEDYFADQPEAP